jgi:type II restriction/modification system DNA methylase subunit YeeA
MNTNQLKRFAQAARNKLIEQVGAKLQFVLTHDTAELRGKQEALKKLKEAQKSLGDEALIEKVAYTWFNRLVALRFMDVNDYQPLGLQVISPATEGGHVPALLEAAHAGHLPEDLGLNTAEINQILDGKTGAANPDNEVFRQLLVAACNQLHEIFPFLFEKINDYTELLLPDDLTSNRSIVNDVVDGMSAEDCAEVEIIGWLYQFYISEKKDEVFASKSKVKKEDIPAATQLFTPRWIVEYMVQNTVGKLWLQNRPQSKLRDYMPYYIESPSAEAEDNLQLSSPEELTLLDQACGSGHILVYGFELLSKIYEEEGYNPSEIPTMIIKNNLFGFEIDERAAQLAGMAVLMKARSYHRRFFRKGDVPEPHILCYQDLKLSEDEIKNVFEKLNLKPSDELIHDLSNMRQATNFGSLIVPHASGSEIKKSLEATHKLKKIGDAFIQYQAEELYTTLRQLELLARKYHCVVDNPPYMGGGNANKDLSDFLKTNYPDSKADLMACFMETGLSVLHPKGFLGMINQHSWMFLSSYEKLRAKLIENTFFDSLLHLGPRTFPEIGGEVVQNASFTFWNNHFENEGAYIRLVDYDKSGLKRTKTLEAIQEPNCGWFYRTNQKDFLKIPGSCIGYWANPLVIKLFDDLSPLGEISDLRSGISTGDNERYYRHWSEVANVKIRFNATSELIQNNKLIDNKKWYPTIRGGEFIKWYGNQEYVMNLEDNGRDIRTSGKNHRLRTPDYYFKKGITWSRISSGESAFRIKTEDVNFGENSPCLFTDEIDIHSLLGILNSPLPNKVLEFLSPTLSFQAADMSKIPVPIEKIGDQTIRLVKENIQIAKECWENAENSWGFEGHKLFSLESFDLEEGYDLYQSFWSNKIHRLHKNEELINSDLIKVYGLEETVTPFVPDENKLALIGESFINEKNIEFDRKEVFARLISYTVGCMFGRYSLDKDGLILANQGETLQDYLAKVGKSETEVSFLPDDDNIIPVLDDEWFEDDIVGRFHTFLKASFGEKNFRKNLDFVEECLGKNMRKYFTKDFYKDHIKRYKKRPIYWMFSSPKGHFNVLVYLHRYTPDTISTILNSYLREFIEKLNLQMKQLKQVEISGSASEQAKARKEMDKLNLMLDDCRDYEEILFELASERIALDLDDGVLVNYNKMGKAVATVPGLNDKKAKDKVKKFDWIDTSQIRQKYGKTRHEMDRCY